MRASGKGLLLVTWIWLMLPSTLFSGGMLPLELWCQASPRGLLRRPHLVKIVLCLMMVWQDHFISAPALTARMRTLYGMRAGQKTISNRLLCRGYCAYRPTGKPLLTANHRRLRLEWAQRWQNLKMAHLLHVILSDRSNSQHYPAHGRLRVRCLPGERFQQRWQAYRVQAGGGSVHVWRAFHSGAKSSRVLPDRNLTG